MKKTSEELKPGDELRDHAASILSSRYGAAKKEVRSAGKKVDIYFEYNDLGKTVKIFVEAKDYNRPLHRSEVVNIKVDYEGLLSRNTPSKLLIVTRSGLSADAQSYVEHEIPDCRHQTIWEIETGAINLHQYMLQLRDEPKESGLE
jgi:Restriction endonuclease